MSYKYKGPNLTKLFQENKRRVVIILEAIRVYEETNDIELMELVEVLLNKSSKQTERFIKHKKEIEKQKAIQKTVKDAFDK